MDSGAVRQNAGTREGIEHYNAGSCTSVYQHRRPIVEEHEGRILSFVRSIFQEKGMAEEVLYAYGYLTAPEVRFLEAAAERLIPTDELGPGGKEAGVACYIDRQLASVWGTHGRNYRSGPWLEG